MLVPSELASELTKGGMESLQVRPRLSSCHVRSVLWVSVLLVSWEVSESLDTSFSTASHRARPRLPPYDNQIQHST